MLSQHQKIFALSWPIFYDYQGLPASVWYDRIGMVRSSIKNDNMNAICQKTFERFVCWTTN
jgi:hypothetical protein